MDHQQLDDLKRFIAATVSQSETRLRDELASKQELREMEQRLTRRMDKGFKGVAAAIHVIHAQLDDHEVRLTDLEQAA